MNGTIVIPLSAAAIVLGAGIGAHEARAQIADERIIPKNASEEYFVQKIKGLDKSAQEAAPIPPQLRRQVAAEELLLFHVDELLKRYPATEFKEDALIAKLRALAHLARASPPHLGQLLTLTGELARGEPKGKLASENAFYAIQAFVLGARREGMPEQRRLQGTIERYRAFLEDYPNSARAAVIHASLIRNLIAVDDGTHALLEFARLQSSHPTHPATRRAAGEVDRLKAVGRPFRQVFTTSEGKTIRPADHLGKVLVIHFWESSNKPSLKQLPELIGLYSKHHGSGLELVSIRLERTPARTPGAAKTPEIPWAQYFEPKGPDSDVVIDAGVIAIPTCFVLDRKGILRSTDPGERLSTLIQQLLTEEHP
ncbi:MAG: TlpA family protein disulfide reductase [Planctomycetota bacterium]